MKVTITYVCLLYLTLIVPSDLNAQSGFVSFGADVQDINGSTSISGCQTFYNNFTSNAGFEAQGLQHPIELLIVSNVTEVNEDIRIYPNPSSESIFLVYPNTKNIDNQLYFLYDIMGNLVKSGTIDTNEFSISLLDLPSASYYLNIRNLNDHSTLNKIFKIVKIQ